MRGRGGLEIPPPLVLGGVLAVPRGVAEGRPGAMSSGAAAMTAASSAARTCGGASSLGASRGATSSGVSVAPNRRLGRVAPRAAPMRAQDRAPRAVAPGADGRNRVEPNFTPKAPRAGSDVVVPSAVSDPRAAVRVEDEFHSREAALRAKDHPSRSNKTRFVKTRKGGQDGARDRDHRLPAHLVAAVRDGAPLADLLAALPALPPADVVQLADADRSGRVWLYETLVRGGRLHNALELLRATRDAGVEGLETRVSHKSFLTQCAKRGAVAVAFDFVAFVDAPDVRLYNMLLSACAKAGDARSAFAAFVRMYDAGVDPDCRAYTTLISACAKAGELEKAFETFRRMEMDGVEPTVVTYGALMDALSRRVHAVAKNDKNKNANARSEEIRRLLRRCFALREEMDDAGVAPDATALNSLLSACARAATFAEAGAPSSSGGGGGGGDTTRRRPPSRSVAREALDRATETFAEMERGRVKCDAYTYASLITACVNAGEPTRAMALYAKSEAVARSPVVYAAAVRACGLLGAEEAAEESDSLGDDDHSANHSARSNPAFSRALAVVRDARAESVAPDAMLYATLIDAAGRCARSAAESRALCAAARREMAEDGLRATSQTFAAEAGVAARRGDAAAVERVLEEMRGMGLAPPLEAHNALLSAAARAGDPDAADAAKARLEAAGLAPDASTYECLIRAAAATRDPERAWAYFEEAKRAGDANVALTRNVFNALVVACGRAGDAEGALRAAREMETAGGLELDAVTWRELLTACARAGDADAAWETYKRSRKAGREPDEVSLNVVVGVTLMKIRELTDPECTKNAKKQRRADQEKEAQQHQEEEDHSPEWKEWADRAIATYHEATVAGVRPRVATFSAVLACLRPPTLPALRAFDRDAGPSGSSRSRSRSASAARTLMRDVSHEDDAHEDARRYYPLRALILYEEAQALGIVPKFHPEEDHVYDIRDFPPAAAEVAVLTLLRVFRRYADSRVGEGDVELPNVTLRVLSDDELAEMEAREEAEGKGGDSGGDSARLRRTGDRVVVLLRRLRFNYGGSLERGRVELSGNVITRWLKAKPPGAEAHAPGMEPRLAGALQDQARSIRARSFGAPGGGGFLGDGVGAAGAFGVGGGAGGSRGFGLGSGGSGVDFFGADDQRYSADSRDEGFGGRGRGRGGRGKAANNSWNKGWVREESDDCMMSELSRITGAEDDARTARGFPGDDAMEEDERASYDGFGIDDDASDEYD